MKTSYTSNGHEAKRAAVRPTQRRAVRRRFADKFVRVCLAVVLATSFVPVGAYVVHDDAAAAPVEAVSLGAGSSSALTTGDPSPSDGGSTITPQATRDLTVTSAAPGGFEALSKAPGEDVYLYDLQGDTVGKVLQMTFGADFFDNRSYTVTVSPPEYGFRFPSTLVDDLTDRATISEAHFVQRYGVDSQIQFTFKGADHTQHVLDLRTEFAAIPAAQCADIITSGWHDTQLKVTVVDDETGDTLVDAATYTLRPNTANYNDIVTVAKHETRTVGDSWYANNAMYDYFAIGEAWYGPGLRYADTLTISMPTAGGADGNALVKLDSFRVYVPNNDDRLVLAGVGYRGTNKPASYLADYFTVNLNNPQYDEEGKRYYLFTARANRPFYNRPATTDAESVGMTAYLTWRIADIDANPRIDYTGNVRYEAKDMLLTYRKPGGATGDATGPGFAFTTLPLAKNNSYGYVDRGAAQRGYGYFKKYQDAEGHDTSDKKVAAGSSFSNVPFVPFYSRGMSGRRTDPSSVEYVGPDTYVETYTFPYEIRPTAIGRGGTTYGETAHEKVVCTIVDAATGARLRDEVIQDPKAAGVMTDLSSLVAEGERIGQVQVTWHDAMYSSHFGNQQSYHAYTIFDFDVTSTHQDGSALEDGAMLHVGYDGSFSESTGLFSGYDKTFSNSVANAQDDYLWFQVEEKKCPWIVDRKIEASPFGYPAYPRDFTSGNVEQMTDYVALKGTAGATRDYLESPTVELRITSSYDSGFSGQEWIALLDSMTLTENMAGWTINYGVYDEATGAAREATYPIGALTGDTQITREALGLNSTESFTSFSFTYDGRYEFPDVRMVSQSNQFIDRSPTGAYEYTYLLRNVKVRMRDAGFTGERLVGCTLNFDAVLTHEGDCDRGAHAEGSGEVSMTDSSSSGYASYLQVRSDYSYVVSGPNFSVSPEEPSVVQGGTIVSDLVFNLNYWGVGGEYLSDVGRRLPTAGVPEAIYVELVDPNVDIDVTNQVFLDSLASHGMTASDVSVVQADGKRWVKLALPPSSSVAWGGKLTTLSYRAGPGYAGTMNFPFKIALRVWEGHEPTTDCHPFGEVFYDLSTWDDVYDGGASSGYKTVALQGTVADEHGLLGDGDTTTARLWKGDASGEAFEVLRNYSTGAVVYPGKNSVVDYGGTTSFTSAARTSLLGALSINSPSQTVTTYDYEAVLTLPRDGAAYDWSVGASANRVTSEFNAVLTGAAWVQNSSLDASSTVSITYSADGSTWKDAGALGEGDWAGVRYVKVHIDQLSPFTSLNVRLPLEAPTNDAAMSKLAYLGGTWTYKDSPTSAARAVTPMAPAVYSMAPVVDYPVTKRLKAPANLGDGTYDHSYPFAAGAFSFVITPVGSAPMPGGVASHTEAVTAATIGADGAQTGGIATFTGNEFDTPGTYRYEIREVIPDDAVGAAGVAWSAATDAQKAQGGFMKDGVVYSERVSTVTVTVTRDSDGRLTATPSTVTGNPVVYENRYEVRDADLVLGGTKALTDANGAEVTRSWFSFVLEEDVTDSSGATTTVVRRNAGLGSDDKTFTFAPLEFTQTDLDAGGERVFRIREAIPEDAVGAAGKAYKDCSAAERALNGFKKLGVTFDQTVYEARVTLSDNGNGTMAPVVKYYRVTDANGAALASTQEVQAADIVFNNKYDAQATMTLQATKDLAGRAWADDDAFTFRLEGVGQMEGGTTGSNGQMTGGTPNAAKPSPMPEGATGTQATATATKAHQTTSFADIKFTLADLGKTYAYKLTEVVPSAPEDDMRYSTAEYGVLVTPVADNGDGTMQVVVTYSLRVKGEGGAADQLIPVHGLPTFVNKKVGQGTATIFADKDLEGRDWKDGDSFTFVLQADHVENPLGTPVAGDVPMPDDAVGGKAYATATPENESAGFGAIPYTQAMEGNVYFYKVTEEVPDGATKVVGKWVKDGIVYSDDERTVRVTVDKISDADTRVTATVEYETTLSDGAKVWTSDIPVDFDNFYTAAPVTVRDMQVQKQLKAPADLNADNDYDQAYAFDAGAFSFTLVPGTYAEGKKSPMPKGEGGADLESITVAAEAGTVDDEGKAHGGYATFPAIEYTEPGSYSYTVTEVVPDDAVRASDDARYGDLAADADKSGVWEKDGVTYTQAAHNVYVVVTDDGSGQLKASVSYRDADNPGHLTDTPTVFTNRYHVWPQVTVSLSGEKSVNGTVAGEGYTIALTRQADEDSNRPDVAAPTRYASSDEAGSFTFPELVYPQFRLGKTSHYFAYEVVPDAAVNAENKAYKDCNEDERARGGFTLDGVTYDASVFQVNVKVVDNRDGTAHAEVSYVRLRDFDGTVLDEPQAVGGLTFDNRYTVQDAELAIGGTKVLTDANGDEVTRSWFSFVMEEDVTDSSGDVTTVVRSSAGLGSDDKTFTFAPLKFTQADLDADGGRVFRIREAIPEDAVGAAGKAYQDCSADERALGGFQKLGVTFDQTAFEAHVALVDNGDGTMSFGVQYYRATDANGVALPGAQEVQAADVTFYNTYDSAATVALQATKDLAGRDWADDDAFTFRLEGVGQVADDGSVDEGAAVPLPDSKTTQATMGAHTVSFGDIRYTAGDVGKTYAYTITEVQPDAADAEPDMRYSASVYDALVKVVRDNGDGTLETAVTYSLRVPGQDGAADSSIPVHGVPVFLNKVVGKGEANIFVDKDLIGRDWTDDDVFTFELQPVRVTDASGSEQAGRDIPLPEGAVGGKATVSVGKDSESAGFGAMRFSVADVGYVYYYQVREQVPDDAVSVAGVRVKNGIVYDEAVHDVRVTVGLVDGDPAKVTATVEYDVSAAGASEPLWTEVPLAEFDNHYVAAPVTVSGIRVQKQLKAPTDLNAADDSGTAYAFAAGEFSFTLVPGTYAEGKTSPMPKGEDGAALTSVTAKAGAGTVDDAGAAQGGYAEFPAIEYTEAGSYSYTVTEVVPDDAVNEAGVAYSASSDKSGVWEKNGVVYTQAAHNVYVVVTDDGAGQLQATVSYRDADNPGHLTDKPAVFTNRYQQSYTPCRHDPPVRKVVEGLPSEPGTFTFKMTAKDPSYPMMEGAVDGVKTVVQTGEGAVEFGEIEFTEPGVYEYTVQEVAGNEAGYTYDSAVWTVRYEVTADEGGVLSAKRTFLKGGEAVDALEATFTNEYRAEDPPVVPDPEPKPDPKPEPEPDPDPDPVSDVSVEKAVDKSFVTSGELVTYTITVRNSGEGAAAGVYVKDYVPTGMTYVSSAGAGAKYGCTTDGRAYATWWIDSIEAGGSETLTLVVRVNECRAGDEFSNVALWDQGSEDRPSPSTDPDASKGGKVTNTVKVFAREGAGQPATKAQPNRPDRVVRGGAPKTGDELGGLALAAFVALAGATALAFVSFRRRES